MMHHYSAKNTITKNTEITYANFNRSFIATKTGHNSPTLHQWRLGSMCQQTDPR